MKLWPPYSPAISSLMPLLPHYTHFHFVQISGLYRFPYCTDFPTLLHWAACILHVQYWQHFVCSALATFLMFIMGNILWCSVLVTFLKSTYKSPAFCAVAFSGLPALFPTAGFTPGGHLSLAVSVCRLQARCATCGYSASTPAPWPQPLVVWPVPRSSSCSCCWPTRSLATWWALRLFTPWCCHCCARGPYASFDVALCDLPVCIQTRKQSYSHIQHTA